MSPSKERRSTDAISTEAAIPFEAVSQAVGASYALLFAERVRDGEVDHTSIHGVDQTYGLRLRRAAAERQLPKWLHDLDTGIVIDRAALQRDHDFVHSDFYNYVVRPEGRFHCLITTPYVTPTHRHHLIVGRPVSRSDFTGGDIGVLRAVLPYVGRLIAIRTEVARATHQSETLLAAFDCMSQNALVVSRGGTVQFANLGARRLLEACDGLSLRDNRLRTATPAMDAELQQAVARVTAIGGIAEAVLQLARPSGCSAFQVTVLRITGALGHGGAPAGSAMILVRQRDDETTIDGWSLRRAYGLTAKEQDIAVLLARGRTLREAARILGMQYNTARCHLRHTFDKTDTHHQGDLIRLVLSASPALRR